LYQVKVIVEEGEGLVDGLNPTQMNWSPGQGQWSIASVFEHLNATGRLYLPVLEGAAAKARQEGRIGEGPFVYGFLARWFLRMTLPPVKRRFSAPAAFRPAAGKDPLAIVAEWREMNRRMHEAMVGASGVDLAAVKVTSPASKLLRLSLGMAYWILTAHEKRHLWQARNVRNNAAFPSA
jgi:hypothetical protein